MAYAEVKDDAVLVQTAWSERELIRQVPGAKWNPADKVWYVPRSWASCVILRGVFGHALTVGDGLSKWAWQERQDRVEPALSLRMMTEFGSSEDLSERSHKYDESYAGKFCTVCEQEEDIPVHWGLYDFQLVGMQFLLTAHDALLGDEMGTGKTIQALAALRVLGADALPAVVICPNSVKANWAKEAARWLPGAVSVIIGGSAKVKRELLTGPALLNSNALVIINIEAVRLHSRLASYGSIRLARCLSCKGTTATSAARCEVHKKELNLIPFKTVIVDEAHRIKDPSSKQTRGCWAVMHQPSVKRRYALTGTPLANDPSDVWSIMHGVSKEEFPTKGHFVERYAQSAWNARGTLDIVGLNPQTKDEFYKIFDPRFRCMPKALVLAQLPQKLRIPRYVEMSLKQAKAYRELEKLHLTRLADGTVLVAPNNLVARMRLMQLASSYCVIENQTDDDSTSMEDWIVRLAEPSPKIDELLLVLEELKTKQLVVAAESRQLIELAAKRLTRLGISNVQITGAVSPFDRERNLARFQAGDERVLLFTVKAGGTGLTMTAADTLVFLQRSWSLVDDIQSEARVHRIGSEHHEAITIIDIITEGTVEQTVQIPRLYQKMARLEEITRVRATMLAAGQSVSDLNVEYDLLMNSDLALTA